MNRPDPTRFPLSERGQAARQSLLRTFPSPHPSPQIGERGEAISNSSPPVGERIQVRGSPPTGAPRAHQVLRGASELKPRAKQGGSNLKA